MLPPPVARDTLQDAVVPLYQPDLRDRPEAVGSGVLLAIEPHAFLLTAAHVLDLAGEDAAAFYLPQGGTLEGLGCPAWKNTVPIGKTREKDTIDLGFYALTEKVVQQLSREPLTLEAVDVRHRPGGTNPYRFCGYPRSTNRPRAPSRSVKPAPFAFTGKSVPHTRYQKLGLSPDEHVVVGVDPDKVVDDATGAIGTMTDPHGISGGGVFRMTRDWAAGSLIGIGLELRRDAKVYVGGRLWTWLREIAKLFPDVAEQIRSLGSTPPPTPKREADDGDS